MSKKTKEFSAFGVKYRTCHFSAVRGLEVMAAGERAHPCEMLSETEVFVEGSGWLSLSRPEVINEHVKDPVGIVSPRLALNGILSLVRDYNFEFVHRWKGTKVPTRFLSDAKTISSSNIDPLIDQLMQDGVATLRELEEYYSIEDAFKMFDSIMIKGINQALAHEASMKKTSRK